MDKGIFKEFNIDLGISGTGMFSPWHKAIMDKYNVHLMATCDVGTFIKHGDKVFRVSPGDYNRFYDYFRMLEDMFNKGEVIKSEIQSEIDEIFAGKSKVIDIYLEPCRDLVEFEEEIKLRASLRN